MSTRMALGNEVDLQNCAHEPIHLPGRIQPHGALLVVTEPDLRIVQASENASQVLGKSAAELLEKTLHYLLPKHQVDRLQSVLEAQSLEAPFYLPSMDVIGISELPDAVLHRRDGQVVVEILPPQAASPLSSERLYQVVRLAVAHLQQSPNLQTLCQRAVEQVRELTGFDRVMMYRFDEEWNGSVVAEDRRGDLESWLGLHFPASDIPAQARELYRRNWLRLIADVDYAPADVVPVLNPITGRVLDMSFSVLRSVSPIHIEYLKNMQVGASMSISVLKQGQLWGLIACHHQTARFVPYETRTACEFLGQIVSVQLPAAEETELRLHRQKMRQLQLELRNQMAREQHLSEGLLEQRPNLMDLIQSDGVAIWNDGRCETRGVTPTVDQIGVIVNWLAERPYQDVFQTHTLPANLPAAEDFKDAASGLLACTVSQDPRFYILWFRGEVLQTIRWGGNPHKPVDVSDDGARISPRRSFEQWKETVQFTSLPWTVAEIDTAADLRQSVMVQQLSSLNRDLSRSNAELDSFAYIASHDLKEPLRGINNYANFLIEDCAAILDEQSVSKLRTLVRLSERMEELINLLLHFSRVGRVDLAYGDIDLSTLLDDAREMLSFSIEQEHVQLRAPRPLPVVHCDRARVGEVFKNLISNAIKYNDKSYKVVEVGYIASDEPFAGVLPAALHRERRPVIFYVRDNGIGIPQKYWRSVFDIFKRLHGRDKFGGGTGAGLTIARKIVERHGGRIWLDSRVGEGTTFYFTLDERDQVNHGGSE